MKDWRFAIPPSGIRIKRACIRLLIQALIVYNKQNRERLHKKIIVNGIKNQKKSGFCVVNNDNRKPR